MRIHDEVFQKKKVNMSSLEDFSFLKEGDGYCYRENFMDDKFHVEITVSKYGSVDSKVIDNEFGDEYYPVNVETEYGSYVAEVREGYREILEKVVSSCFSDEYFIYPQSNRLAALIEEKYGETPDFPFKKLPDYGVFRYNGNDKWYGLVMNIARGLLNKDKRRKFDNTIVEILNLKIDPADEERLTAIDGIYPSYHMNRKNWISILLDGSVKDEEIMKLIDDSRNIVMENDVKKKKGTWIVPANPKYYDIVSRFRQKKDVIWKQGARIKTGDTVYMYLAAPYSCVKYKCLVTETDIPYEFSSKEVSMRYIMKMDVLEEYPDDYCRFDTLRKTGINAVRGQRTVTEDFIKYMEKA